MKIVTKSESIRAQRDEYLRRFDPAVSRFYRPHDDRIASLKAAKTDNEIVAALPGAWGVLRCHECFTEGLEAVARLEDEGRDFLHDICADCLTKALDALKAAQP